MTWLDKIVNMIYPPVCGICHQLGQDYLCSCCKDKMKRLENKQSFLNRNEQESFKECFSLFCYQELIRELILTYKFENEPYLAKTFAEILLNSKKVVGMMKSYDIIVPIPMDDKRKRQRGYNQCELLAKELVKCNPVILFDTNVLAKQKNRKVQSSLGKEERQENVKEAFYLKQEKAIVHKKVLLLDDIYTTGSTVRACSKVITKAGAKQVGVITIAKD